MLTSGERQPAVAIRSRVSARTIGEEARSGKVPEDPESGNEDEQREPQQGPPRQEWLQGAPVGERGPVKALRL